MARQVVSVLRTDGGWAVVHERRILATYRHQEEAIAHARLHGHDLWDHGHACEVLVYEASGRARPECAYGRDAR